MDAEQYAAARAEETFYLRQQLAEAARQQPEYVRMEMTEMALRANLSLTGGQFLLLPHEECLTVVYGPDGSRKFWGNYLSRTTSAPSFLRLMALMGAHNNQEEQVRGLALRSALRDAFDMGETWLVRGTSLEDDRLMVIPRHAVEWLLHNPMWCHLLPPSLGVFFERRSSAAPLQLPPFDEHEAHGILAGMKVSGATRPTRDEAKRILAARFDSQPRDPIDRIIRKVWGEGKRGPRNPRNSPARPQGKSSVRS